MRWKPVISRVGACPLFLMDRLGVPDKSKSLFLKCRLSVPEVSPDALDPFLLCRNLHKRGHRTSFFESLFCDGGQTRFNFMPVLQLFSLDGSARLRDPSLQERQSPLGRPFFGGSGAEMA